MSAFEVYQPFLQVCGFLSAWGIAMLTGLLFSKAAD